LLAGCSGDDSEEAAVSTTTTTTAAASTTSTQAPAAPPVTIVTVTACGDAQSTLEMNDCYGKQFAEADRQLNDVYQRLISSLPETKKLALVNDERKWIEQRDTTCDAAAKQYEGGTLAGTTRLRCMVDETLKRDRVLIDQLNKL
jgi:uncharacterized protein YecT (DUF1311 family)